MPIKIAAKGKKLDNASSIEKDHIKELMIRYGRHTGKKRKGSTKVDPYDRTKDTSSAWYSLKEIIAFLRDNYVDLSPGADLTKYGVRIYFGMHHEKNTYQPRPSSGKAEDYYFLDTPILVLTKKNGNVDEDQLHEGSSVSMGPLFNPDEGLDNARLCPPECSGVIEDLNVKEEIEE